MSYFLFLTIASFISYLYFDGVKSFESLKESTGMKKESIFTLKSECHKFLGAKPEKTTHSDKNYEVFTKQKNLIWEGYLDISNKGDIDKITSLSKHLSKTLLLISDGKIYMKCYPNGKHDIVNLKSLGIDHDSERNEKIKKLLK